MNSQAVNPTQTPTVLQGFDRPTLSRDGDHLNRWPLAREIYGIATTGPSDWSVRVGIYGEWGTGKTSVLKFIASMAEKAGHIVIWFDPWQYSNKPELWQEFVLTVFRHLKIKLGQIPGASKANRKFWMKKARGVIGAVASVAYDRAGKAIDAGLELVKKHFAFTRDDLKSLESILDGNRVIVLIDDLDRTAPELVPEILFALKELMDIPGFSFVCAFDPVVVGEVLGTYHPGFGNGLKFLDKIIDYPRWLPSPSAEGLANLAIADARHSCDYVPKSAIRDALPLLPANPRAVRQFIRLLALLKPQIQRHYDSELNWPAIIAANILKVRHPQIAQALLNDGNFWDGIGVIGLGLSGENEQEHMREAIDQHIKKTSDKNGFSLEPSQQTEIKAAILAICSQINLFGGLHGESVTYQVNIAETPAAVTWKEFDEFLSRWELSQVTDMVKAWIDLHVQRTEKSNVEVYGELLSAAIRRYAQILHQADNVFTEGEKRGFITQANSIFALLKSLVFDLGQLAETKKQIGDAELELLVKTFASFAGASSMPVHAQFWLKNQEFILDLFEQWRLDLMPLIRILNPYTGILTRDFDGASARELHKKLCAVALPNFARELVQNFREAGFVKRLIQKQEDTFAASCMVSDVTSPFWDQFRSEILQVLTEAASNRAVQENAYQFLYWFILLQKGRLTTDPPPLEKVLSNQSLASAIWNAATATPLAPGAVYQLLELPKILQRFGVRCELPSWWQQTLAAITAPNSATPATETVSLGTLPEEES